MTLLAPSWWAIDKVNAAAPAIAPKPPEATKPAPTPGDGVFAPNPAAAPAPPPRPGALNPAYTTTATNDDVHTEVGNIKGRIELRTGQPATAPPVLAAFERNLERKVRASIIAMAVKKYGAIPTKPSVDATYAVWSNRWLAKFLEAAQRELHAHNHAAHAQGLAHEKHLAQMHVDQIARGQEQRTGQSDQRIATDDRRQSKPFKVKYNRRESGDDRRAGDRRAAGPAEKVEVITEHDWIGKYDEAPDFVATSVADLVKGKVKYKGDLTNIVYRYLLRSYPEKAIEWVNDPDGEWEYNPHVKLSDINMARRPGGRDPAKVSAISKTLGDGASLDPIVLVDDDNPAGLEIADGWHRSLGAEDAGLDDVPAFIGSGFGKNLGLSAPWGTEMQDESDSKKRAELSELAVLRRFLRKGGLVENFRTTIVSDEVMEALAADVTKLGPDAALERARMRLEGVYFEPSKKDFSLSSPLASSLAPYGLDQAPSPGDSQTCDTCGAVLVPDRDGEGWGCPNGHKIEDVEKYSDDEARDEHGKWVAAGGGEDRRVEAGDVRAKTVPPQYGDKQAANVHLKTTGALLGQVRQYSSAVQASGRSRSSGVKYVTVWGAWDDRGRSLGASNNNKADAIETVTRNWNVRVRGDSMYPPFTRRKVDEPDIEVIAAPDLTMLAAIDAELRRRGVDPEAI